MGIKPLEKLLLDSILLDCCSDEEDIEYELSEEDSDDNISEVFDCGCCDDCSCDDNMECENCNCECCCEMNSIDEVSSDTNNFNINIIEDNMKETLKFETCIVVFFHKIPNRMRKYIDKPFELDILYKE
jgi:hypothetical protein